jgi:hypothetical protein
MTTPPSPTGILSDIINKVRRITGRPSTNQISDSEICNYINTYYLYDMPAQIKSETFRTTYNFITQPNIAVYNFPTDYYLEGMPPVYIGGYQSYMTQSRENFYRFNPQLNYLQSQVATGDGSDGSSGTYVGTLSATPVMRGFRPNNIDASSSFLSGSTVTSPGSLYLNSMSNVTWMVMFSAVGASGETVSLIDDGQGILLDISDNYGDITNFPARGTIDYITGAFTLSTFIDDIPIGNAINAQYVPYVASRPQSCVFYNDQIMVYPIPDQAYTVSFEAYQKPTAAFSTSSPDSTNLTPKLKELWQLLAYGAADKIFADNGDVENMMKFRPLLEEQIKFCLRRTICQYTSERAATIYTEQSGLTQYPFGNMYSGF